jgi:hypothetical protein
VRLANEDIYSKLATITEENHGRQTDSNENSREEVMPLAGTDFIDDVFPDLNQERNMRNDSVF